MRVLIVEDGSQASAGLRRLIEAAGHGCTVRASSAKDALGPEGAFVADLIFVVASGATAAAADGLSVVRRLREQGTRAPIAVIADRQDGGFVREALRAGVQDVLYVAEVDARSIGNWLERCRTRQDFARHIAGGDAGAARAAVLIGRSQPMQAVRRMVHLVAQSSAPVLILGETGTGKGLVARAIHEAGPRGQQPLVAINCAATPANLMESVMFGHERGSFTGAFKRQRGHFELVGGGTILLDEVADITLELQPKLLHAVEERRFRPIGAEDESSFGGRILASTNADLRERMQTGRFRPDLYYRLSVLEIRLPPLAERREDIPDLLEAFCASSERAVHLTDEAIGWLAARSWPGNVRELKNAVDRLAILCPNEEVDVRAAREIIGQVGPDPNDDLGHLAKLIASLPGTLPSRFETIERLMVLRALREANGNRSAAARSLGVHRRVVDRHAPQELTRGHSRRPDPSGS